MPLISTKELIAVALARGGLTELKREQRRLLGQGQRPCPYFDSIQHYRPSQFLALAMLVWTLIATAGLKTLLAAHGLVK